MFLFKTQQDKEVNKQFGIDRNISSTQGKTGGNSIQHIMSKKTLLDTYFEVQIDISMPNMPTPKL